MILISLSALILPTSTAKKLPNSCQTVLRSLNGWPIDISRIQSERIVSISGIGVTLRERGWYAQNERNAAWTLRFHSLGWLLPVALEQPNLAIELFQERDRILIDPGLKVGISQIQSSGWTEGQVTWRLGTATCLYALTRDQRLVPIVEQLVAASKDPDRYRGLPNKKVHNHGAFSNLAIISAGRILGREEWIEFALGRARADLKAVFDSCGMAAEQSSAYQKVNISVYRRLLGDAALSAPISALSSLARPDGVLEAIGDGKTVKGLTPSKKELWCPESGWAAGRIGKSHFTLRFGPAQNFHGHLDHGGITWFAEGIPILSDRQVLSKDQELLNQSRSMASHSVFEPVGFANYNPATLGIRVSLGSYRLEDYSGSIRRLREVKISPKSIEVKDQGFGATKWIQHFQLATGWWPRPGGAIHTSGKILNIDCAELRAVKIRISLAESAPNSAWDMQCHFSAANNKVVAKTKISIKQA
jgi:hypothetical protein